MKPTFAGTVCVLGCLALAGCTSSSPSRPSARHDPWLQTPASTADDWSGAAKSIRRAMDQRSPREGEVESAPMPPVTREIPLSFEQALRSSAASGSVAPADLVLLPAAEEGK